jgi:hypothetical protein
MEEYIPYILCVCVGLGFGWKLREYYAISKLTSLIEELEEQVEVEEGKTDASRMTLEKHGDHIYAFEENGEFIAQGAKLEDLDLAIQARFPGRKFIITEKNLEDIGVIKP